MEARAIAASVLATAFAPFVLFNLIRDARWIDISAICVVALYAVLAVYLTEQGELGLRNSVYLTVGLFTAILIAVSIPTIKRVRERRNVMRLHFPFEPTHSVMVRWCTLYLKGTGWRVRRVPEVDLQVSRPNAKTFYVSFYPAGQPVSEETFGAIAPAVHMRKNRVVLVAYETPTPYIIERGRQRGVLIIHYSQLDTLETR